MECEALSVRCHLGREAPDNLAIFIVPLEGAERAFSELPEVEFRRPHEALVRDGCGTDAVRPIERRPTLRSALHLADEVATLAKQDTERCDPASSGPRLALCPVEHVDHQ